MKYVILERRITRTTRAMYDDGVEGFGVFQRFNDTSRDELMPGDVWLADFRYRERAEEFAADKQEAVF